MKANCAFETTWLQEYAGSFRPTDAPFRFAEDDLRRAGLTVVDIMVALREGEVVWADKLDGPGAIWTVMHSDDELDVELDLIVESEMQRVTLHRIRT